MTAHPGLVDDLAGVLARRGGGVMAWRRLADTGRAYRRDIRPARERGLLARLFPWFR